MKKIIIALVLTVFMVAALGVTAFANVGFDALYVDVNSYQGNAGHALDAEISVEVGQKLFILGWFAEPGKTVDKVVWTLDGVEKDCADNYRDRTEIADLAAFKEAGFSADDFVKAGFGKDTVDQGGLMELLGVDALTDGTYTVSIIGKFTDGSTTPIKEDFTLIVGTGVAADPQQTVDRPATNEPAPQTGDASVAMLAVIAVLALSAVVVFVKKRAF